MVSIEKYTGLVRAARRMIFFVPMIVYVLILLGIVVSSGFQREDLHYLLTFATVGGAVFAVTLLVIDIVACCIVLVVNRRHPRSESQWKIAMLRIGEVFVTPILLWLMSWLVLELATRI